ncbi:MAG: hypothetical protein EHM49_00835 [Deltaproteobacteria bacterium]|nr:MAG: hypothetical protein EHM49_00835 [Deltaproteobacteria bacterium]
MDNKAVSSYQDDLLAQVDPWIWAYKYKIALQSNIYQLKGHEWQIEPMQCSAKSRVARKAAQLGFSELEILRTLHGMIYGLYPTGVLYLFPTSDDVSDFSKARFGPLIADNPATIGSHVQSTDSTNIKRIGSGMLYLRGARLSSKVEGVKADSSKLRSIPVDKVVFDERDLMANEAVAMAVERMSHSDVQEYVSFSTPTIPDFGIDKEYQESDQRLWLIKCGKCNHETCLETEFTECINSAGQRVCTKCGNEIYPRNGRWVASYPDREVAGWWISQLQSSYIDPLKILTLYNDPPNGNLQEVYNSKLGMAYIAAENRLSQRDIYACCGLEPMLYKSHMSCAMGVDVGKMLHAVIGYRINKTQYRIVKVAAVPKFEDLHDLARKFSVRHCVIDALPETHKVRDFQRNEPYPVYLCQYQESLGAGQRLWNDGEGMVKVNRTEVCDETHTLITTLGKCELPRRNEVIETYAKQMSNIAKVLEEDKVSGSKIYRYRKLGDDHYRHATNYWLMSVDQINPSSKKENKGTGFVNWANRKKEKIKDPGAYAEFYV